MNAQLYKFIFVTLTVQLLQLAITLDPATITNWKAWAIAGGAGVLRAVAQATLTYITSQRSGNV